MSVNVPMAPRSGAVRAEVLPMPFSLRTDDAAEFNRLSLILARITCVTNELK